MQNENDEEEPEGDFEKDTNEKPSAGLTLGDLFAHLGIQETINAGFQRLMDRFNQAMIEAFDPYKLILERLEEFTKRFPQLEEEAIKVLNRYHWLPFQDMSTAFVVKLVELSRQPGNNSRKVNHMFVAHFLSNDCLSLVAMTESWKRNPLFIPRMKILRDCVQVVRRADRGYNPANVVLPTLIAQIDGILTELGRHKGEPFPSARSADFTRWLRRHTQEEYFADANNQFILQVLFRQTRNSKGQEVKIPYRYNRHKVLHGQHLHYGTLPDLIRTFLVLDYLAHVKL